MHPAAAVSQPRATPTSVGVVAPAAGPRLPVRVAVSRRSVVTNAAASEKKSPFAFETPMDGSQSALSGIATPVLYAAGALFTAAAGAVGYQAGGKAPEGMKTVAGGVGAAVGVGAAAFAAHEAVKKRASAAPIELWNTLAAMSDPEALSAADVEALNAKYGFKLAEKQAQEVKGIYDAYLESIIPQGEEPLRGDEHERARRFLGALGLSDEDAAAVHIDVARRLTRARFESKDRQSAREGQRGFQKIIYVSALLFGEAKSAYLLPWKRLFGLTDAQVIVAKRDNAKDLFAGELARRGGVLEADAALLTGLREFQTRVRLSDDVAEECVREAIAAKALACLDAAVECIKRRGRRVDYSDALDAVAELEAFNAFMAAAAAEQAALEERTMVPGLGPATAHGSKYDGEARKDLRDLYRIVTETRLERDGAFTPELEATLSALATASIMGTSEAEDIRSSVVTGAYRKLLRTEVTSGRLAAAESPAAVLQGLCEKVAMAPEDAQALHISLYRQRLSTLLEDKALSDEDVATLDGLRKMLCIPAGEVKAAHLELCGKIYRSAVQNAMGLGIDNFSLDDRSQMKKVLADVRLESEDAKQILEEEGRKQLMTFVNASRLHRNRLDAAKELKKAVFFSNMVLSPLIESTKSEEEIAAEKEQAEADAKAQIELQKMLKEAQEAAAKEEAAEKEAQEASTSGDVEADAAKIIEEVAAEAEAEASTDEEGPSTLAKATKAKEARAEGETIVDGSGVEVMVKAQKSITLAEDLDVRDRQDIYKNYLLYCMSGDVVSMPMGGQIVLERDEQEFARLSQLGDILGLQQPEVMEVHTSLAEQAFRAQAQGIAGDGSVMTPEKADKLEEMRKGMGLSEEAAAKIIKGVQNERMIKNMAGSKAAGALTLEKVIDLKESGIDIANFVSEDQRVALLRDQVESAMSSGAGELDEAFLLGSLPEDLGIESAKVTEVVEGYAKDRRRTIFVQAASLFRQKKMDDAVGSLNNYVVATRMLQASDAPDWRDREELLDMYAVYAAKVADEPKRAALQAALHISDDEAAAMRDMLESGTFNIETEDADAAFF